MKYFLHDTNAFQDEKITELHMRFGYEGLGLFYTILERIGAQEKPIKTSVLKTQLKVGKKLEKCWSFMEEIELISSKNGETFNERILSYSKKYQIQKEKTRERVEKFRTQKTENDTNPENVTRYTGVTKRVSNARKVKESKVNRSNSTSTSKEETINNRTLTTVVDGAVAPVCDKEDDEFKKFQSYILNHAGNVSRMKEPFTLAQYREVKKKFNSGVVKEILEEMHNYAPLTKKNVSAYLTLCNWIRRRDQNPKSLAPQQSVYTKQMVD